jgi:hypothetical protein
MSEIGQARLRDSFEPTEKALTTERTEDHRGSRLRCVAVENAPLCRDHA